MSSVWLMVVCGDVMSIIYVALRQRPQQEEMHTSQSQSSTDQRACQSSVQSPEEREAVHAEETREVEPSAAHSQSDLQSSEVGAPAEEPVSETFIQDHPEATKAY